MNVQAILAWLSLPAHGPHHGDGPWAGLIARTPTRADALPELLNAVHELYDSQDPEECEDGALRALAAAYASAGMWSIAFEIAQSLVRCQQLETFLDLYQQTQR